MATNYTYEQIANDFQLWGEYFDTSREMTEEEFNEMSTEAKVQLQVEAFGPESNMSRTTALDYVDGIEGAAAVITDGTSSFDSDYIAGQYAFDAAREADDGMSEAELEAHLEAVADAGAVFDHAKALAVAKKFVAANAND